MRNQKEYDNLRKEIKSGMSVVRKANNALYVGITAIFAWSITTSNSLICLLAYCVIIPIYFIVLDYNISIMKLGAYLLVFHEDKWEKRLHKLNVKKIIIRHASSYKYSFVCASLATNTLFFYFLDYKHIEIFEIIQIAVAIVLFLCFNFYVLLQKNNDKIKEKYINAWKEIKMEENTI